MDIQHLKERLLMKKLISALAIIAPLSLYSAQQVMTPPQPAVVNHGLPPATLLNNVRAIKARFFPLQRQIARGLLNDSAREVLAHLATLDNMRPNFNAALLIREIGGVRSVLIGLLNKIIDTLQNKIVEVNNALTNQEYENSIPNQIHAINLTYTILATGPRRDPDYSQTLTDLRNNIRALQRRAAQIQ
jgi:hypothetical protein